MNNWEFLCTIKFEVLMLFYSERFFWKEFIDYLNKLRLFSKILLPKTYIITVVQLTSKLD